MENDSFWEVSHQTKLIIFFSFVRFAEGNVVDYLTLSVYVDKISFIVRIINLYTMILTQINIIFIKQLMIIHNFVHLGKQLTMLFIHSDPLDTFVAQNG